MRTLLGRVAAQMNEDALEADTEVLALSYIGEAYDEMMRVYLPFIDKVVLAPEDGSLSGDLLGEECGRIISVEQKGKKVPVAPGAVLPDGVQGPITVRCRYVPKSILGNEDVPELPAAFHGALADYATYRLLGTGGRERRQRGDMFFARFLQRKAMLPSESALWRDTIANKYA